MKQLSLLVLALCCALTSFAQPPDFRLNFLAEDYVRLALAVGQHDADYIDAYYGPPEWKRRAEKTKLRLNELQAQATALSARLKAEDTSKFDNLLKLRHAFLSRQLRALSTKLSMLSGKALPFDEESRLLYDAVLPEISPQHAAEIRAKMETLLPGDGPLNERFERFDNQFIVPKEKVEELMKSAIAECRRRTLLHIALPEGEDFKLSLVTGKSWSAYNWYKGNSQSLIEVNTDLPFKLAQAIGLAAHEGYPGHHVYNVLLEREFMRKRGWVEFSVYPLYSPQSLIAEGTAEFGVDVVFPMAERVKFSREVLFPLAGLDPALAERYFEVLHAKTELGLVSDDICRRHLDGKLTREAAVKLMVSEALMTQERAEKFLDFAQHYRAYLTTYHTGYLLVKNYVETLGGTAKNESARWSIFSDLIASPRLPSDLR